MSVESFINRIAKRDTIVYWGTPTNAADGTVTYAAPVEMDAVWVEDIRRIKDYYEKEIASRAHVYVTTDLEERAMVYHGTLADLTTAQKANPSTIPNAYEIRRFAKVPSLAFKDKYERKAYV